MAGPFGIGVFGTDPYGSSLSLFHVSGALSLGSTYVQVSFSDILDTTYSPLLNPSNYTITPSLNIHAVQVLSATSVRLHTDPQSFIAYTVEVGVARSFSGQSLSPPKTAIFWGSIGVLHFFAVGTDRQRVRLVFDGDLLDNFDLTDPANYLLTDMFGGILGVTEVVREAVPPSAVDLILSTDQQPTQFYSVHLSPLIRGAQGEIVTPNNTLYQFVETATQAGRGACTIPLSAFSGEVVGDPYLGTPEGLVFFSPSLEVSSPNSIIQVDEVAVCTKAYDEYHIPQPPDPKVLYTFGDGHRETLGGGVSLWAPFPRLVDARFELRQQLPEPMPQAVDSRCIATFREPWDHTYVSLLNNVYWKIFDNGTTPPAYFATASNLAPIPPGPTTVRVLEP